MKHISYTSRSRKKRAQGDETQEFPHSLGLRGEGDKKNFENGDNVSVEKLNWLETQQEITGCAG